MKSLRDLHLFYEEISLFTWSWGGLFEAYALENDELFANRLYALLNCSEVYFTGTIPHKPLLNCERLHELGIKEGV